MKKTLSMLLTILMLFSIINVSAFAEGIETPKTTASNAVTGIKVYWNAVDGAVKYNVYRRNAGEKNWIIVGSSTKTNLIDTNVENGKYYAYSVRAYAEDNSYSSYNSKLTYAVKCVTTPKLADIQNTTKGIQIAWSVVSGSTYRVYRRGAGTDKWTYLATTRGTTYYDSKATSGNYWRYTVRAVSSGYYSGFDTTGLYTMRLANPYSIKATVKVGCVSVTWGKINGATGYRVYKRAAGETYWTYLGSTNTTSFIDSNVKKGQYYRYTVRATRGNIFSSCNTKGPVVYYNSHNPIKNPEDLIDLWFTFTYYGYIDGEILPYSEKFSAYVPEEYRDYPVFFCKLDCCRNYNDYLSHIDYYFDTDIDYVRNSILPKKDTFVMDNILYLVCFGGKGGPGYERLVTKKYDDGTVVIDALWGIDNKKDVFTMELINGSYKVVDFESWVDA